MPYADCRAIYLDPALKVPAYREGPREVQTLPDGRRATACVFYRRGHRGVRVQVVESAGFERVILFDTDDCFDLANAINKVNHWAAGLFPEVYHAS